MQSNRSQIPYHTKTQLKDEALAPLNSIKLKYRKVVKIHTMVNQCYLPSQFFGMLQQIKWPAMDEIIAKTIEIKCQ